MQAAMDQAEFFAFCKGTASVTGLPGLGSRQISFRENRNSLLQRRRQFARLELGPTFARLSQNRVSRFLRQPRERG
jgi:hypothetical protein